MNLDSKIRKAWDDVHSWFVIDDEQQLSELSFEFFTKDDMSIVFNRILQDGIYETHSIYHSFKDETEELLIEKDIERFLSENCWSLTLISSINGIRFQLYFQSLKEGFFLNACLDPVIFEPRTELYENYIIFESAVGLFFELFELTSCQKLYLHPESADLDKFNPTLTK